MNARDIVGFIRIREINLPEIGPQRGSKTASFSITRRMMMILAIVNAKGGTRRRRPPSTWGSPHHPERIRTHGSDNPLKKGGET